MGLVKGSASLVTKTIAGAFNSISKITGTLSSGLTALSMDQNYIKERERQRAKKPKNIVEGFGKGVLSIGTGIFRGLAGLFLEPYLGAKRKGFTGAIKGFGMGLAGVITKPLEHIGDAIQNVADGA